MRSRLATLALLATIPLLAACSAQPAEPAESSAQPSPSSSAEAESPSPTPSASPTPTETATITSDRAYLVKELGETGGLANVDEQVMIFSLAEIRYDYECDYVAPANGQFVGLRYDVEVLANWPVDDPGFGPTFSMYYPDFQAFLADGTRINDPIGNGGCAAPSDALPVNLGPAQTASGWIVLDLPDDAAAVAFVPASSSGSGWEWRLDG